MGQNWILHNNWLFTVGVEHVDPSPFIWGWIQHVSTLQPNKIKSLQQPFGILIQPPLFHLQWHPNFGCCWVWVSGKNYTLMKSVFGWYHVWLVVGPPLWKIWVRHLGWWVIPNISGKMPNWWQPFTTNQMLYLDNLPGELVTSTMASQGLASQRWSAGGFDGLTRES